MIKIIKFSILIGVLLLNSCGTDTGNPVDLPVNHSPAIGESFTSIICQKIKGCGWNTDTCGNSVYNDTNIGAKIGSPYSDLKSLQQLYHEKGFGNSSRIEFDEVNQTLCLDSIANLSCSSATLTDAFKASATNPFENIYLIFNANSICEQIIKQN